MPKTPKLSSLYIQLPRWNKSSWSTLLKHHQLYMLDHSWCWSLAQVNSAVLKLEGKLSAAGASPASLPGGCKDSAHTQVTATFTFILSQNWLNQRCRLKFIQFQSYLFQAVWYHCGLQSAVVSSPVTQHCSGAVHTIQLLHGYKRCSHCAAAGKSRSLMWDILVQTDMRSCSISTFLPATSSLFLLRPSSCLGVSLLIRKGKDTPHCANVIVYNIP